MFSLSVKRRVVLPAMCLAGMLAFVSLARADLPTSETQVHGYHAFGFSEIAIIAGFRAHGHRIFLDSLNTAKELDAAIDALGKRPSQKTLDAAREAWITARQPYSYSEVLRFIFPPIDHWDKSVNAWPLDEGLIDYVSANSGASDDNPYAGLNIIANQEPLVLGQKIDARQITPALLRDQLHELDSIESNVAIGYHAIEFLLWGQDNNGTQAGAGQRPWTDFSTKRCTNGNCDRRFDYLKSASTLLVQNLSDMEIAWRENGEITEQIMFAEPADMLQQILEGVITFLNAELISERLRLPLRLKDPEHELDCFSDQTHASLYHNFMGIRMVLMAEYPGERPDDAKLINLLQDYKENYNALYYAQEAMHAIYAAGEQSKKSSRGVGRFDQMLAVDNARGQELITNAIKSLNLVSLRLVQATQAFKQADRASMATE